MIVFCGYPGFNTLEETTNLFYGIKNIVYCYQAIDSIKIYLGLPSILFQLQVKILSYRFFTQDFYRFQIANAIIFYIIRIQ